jgi:DNA uptake protein ComE-like DNA-binding protein
LADNSGDDGARKVLMTLPGMTESIADAILDWLDEDHDSRLLGAERDYYSSQDPPYAPRNGPIGSIEELLLVRDVTPALLFGADLNRNTGIEAGEEPLTAIENVDNSMGVLNRGWAAYLTLDSAESNLRPDGTPKIDINMENLEDLHKQLVTVLDRDMANFIVAFRQGGPYDGDGAGQPASGITLDFTQPGRQRLNTILDLIGVSTQIARPAGGGGGGGGGGGSEGGGRDGGGRDGGGSGEGGRGGNQNQNSRIVVEAAFPDQPSAMQRYLAKLMDNVTVNPAPAIPGRLNINQAPRQLLAGVPGLNSTAVDRIIANRDVTLGQQRPEQVYETWLLTDGIVELDQMKRLMALVTTGGSVYRAQVVGFYDAEGPADRLEVVIDATQTPPIVRRRWELRDLGPGYSREVLGVPAEDVP